MMATLFETDRRLHDRARAEAVKASASACAVATGLLGANLIDGGGPASDWAIVTCPFLARDCIGPDGLVQGMKASKTGAGWICACGKSGDTVQLVREVSGVSFGQAVDLLIQLVATAGASDTADMFGGGA
jgi:hypothetical protein